MTRVGALIWWSHFTGLWADIARLQFRRREALRIAVLQVGLSVGATTMSRAIAKERYTWQCQRIGVTP